MADGGLKIELDAELAARLKEAAEAAGRSADDYASVLIAHGLDDGWGEARASLADYDRTGSYVDADEALSNFRQRLAKRVRRGR